MEGRLAPGHQTEQQSRVLSYQPRAPTLDLSSNSAPHAKPYTLYRADRHTAYTATAGGAEATATRPSSSADSASRQQRQPQAPPQQQQHHSSAFRGYTQPVGAQQQQQRQHGATSSTPVPSQSGHHHCVVRPTPVPSNQCNIGSLLLSTQGQQQQQRQQQQQQLVAAAFQAPSQQQQQPLQSVLGLLPAAAAAAAAAGWFGAQSTAAGLRGGPNGQHVNVAALQALMASSEDAGLSLAQAQAQAQAHAAQQFQARGAADALAAARAALAAQDLQLLAGTHGQPGGFGAQQIFSLDQLASAAQAQQQLQQLQQLHQLHQLQQQQQQQREQQQQLGWQQLLQQGGGGGNSSGGGNSGGSGSEQRKAKANPSGSATGAGNSIPLAQYDKSAARAVVLGSPKSKSKSSNGPESSSPNTLTHSGHSTDGEPSGSPPGGGNGTTFNNRDVDMEDGAQADEEQPVDRNGSGSRDEVEEELPPGHLLLRALMEQQLQQQQQQQGSRRATAKGGNSDGEAGPGPPTHSGGGATVTSVGPASAPNPSAAAAAGGASAHQQRLANGDAGPGGNRDAPAGTALNYKMAEISLAAARQQFEDFQGMMGPDVEGDEGEEAEDAAADDSNQQQQQEVYVSCPSDCLEITRHDGNDTACQVNLPPSAAVMRAFGLRRGGVKRRASGQLTARAAAEANGDADANGADCANANAQDGDGAGGSGGGGSAGRGGAYGNGSGNALFDSRGGAAGAGSLGAANGNNNAGIGGMMGLVDLDNQDDGGTKLSKKPRLIWTAELHARFLSAVNHLGVKNAVPRTILQLMNVEGMTRENVASHLQKYRLYLKRMAGLPANAPLSTENLHTVQTVQQAMQLVQGAGAAAPGLPGVGPGVAGSLAGALAAAAAGTTAAMGVSVAPAVIPTAATASASANQAALAALALQPHLAAQVGADSAAAFAAAAAAGAVPALALQQAVSGGHLGAAAMNLQGSQYQDLLSQLNVINSQPAHLLTPSALKAVAAAAAAGRAASALPMQQPSNPLSVLQRAAAAAAASNPLLGMFGPSPNVLPLGLNPGVQMPVVNLPNVGGAAMLGQGVPLMHQLSSAGMGLPNNSGIALNGGVLQGLGLGGGLNLNDSHLSGLAALVSGSGALQR